MRFYTGFPNCSSFLAVFNYLNPGYEGENIAYWLSQSNVSFQLNSMTNQRENRQENWADQET